MNTDDPDDEMRKLILFIGGYLPIILMQRPKGH